MKILERHQKDDITRKLAFWASKVVQKASFVGVEKLGLTTSSPRLRLLSKHSPLQCSDLNLVLSHTDSFFSRIATLTFWLSNTGKDFCHLVSLCFSKLCCIFAGFTLKSRP